MNAAPQPRRRRLGELLIDAGVLDDAKLKSALVEQRKWGGKLGRTLVELGFVEEAAMCRALSQQLQLPSVDLDAAVLQAAAVQLLRVDLAERYGVFPLGTDATGRTLIVATSDPTNIEAMQELGLSVGLRVQPTVATGSAIDRAIRRYYYGEEASQRKATPAAAVAVRGAPPVRRTATDPAVALDELLGNGPGPAAPSETAVLKKELAVLREHVDALEKVNAGQVRALRGLVELLVQSGLVSRDEYLAKVQRGD